MKRNTAEDHIKKIKEKTEAAFQTALMVTATSVKLKWKPGR